MWGRLTLFWRVADLVKGKIDDAEAAFRTTPTADEGSTDAGVVAHLSGGGFWMWKRSGDDAVHEYDAALLGARRAAGYAAGGGNGD